MLELDDLFERRKLPKKDQQYNLKMDSKLRAKLDEVIGLMGEESTAEASRRAIELMCDQVLERLKGGR